MQIKFKLKFKNQRKQNKLKVVNNIFYFDLNIFM